MKSLADEPGPHSSMTDAELFARIEREDFCQTPGLETEYSLRLWWHEYLMRTGQ